MVNSAARGLFRLQDITPLVGDYVDIDIDESDNTGFIKNIYDRKTELIRPRVANVTQAVITFSVSKPGMNMDLLDRFILAAEMAGVTPLICINKMDLKAAKNFRERFANTYKTTGYKLFFVSTMTNEGIDALRNALSGHISVFAGPSGVGKTSVINALFGNLELKTGEVSRKTERGKHTTRHAELMLLHEDSYVVDTPGFTSLDITVGEYELASYFPEFAPLTAQCFFNNCFHETEEDCAVKARVGDTVSEGRYKAYLRILQEIRGKRDEYPTS